MRPVLFCMLLCGFLLRPFFARAQPAAPYASEIAAFAAQDSAAPPPQGAILFVGSSSFRMWTDIDRVFPNHQIINRGFGGATILDVERYAPAVIYRYQPAQIVFYCGENDLAASDTVQAQTVVQRFVRLFGQIRRTLPGVPFVFVSIKPSPSRAYLLPRMQAANRSIRQFLQRWPNTRYVDVYRPMLLPGGRPNGALFGSDSLHMNKAGYALWQQKLEPVLRRR